MPSPNPGGPVNFNYLTGLTTTATTSPWAVGYYFNGVENRTLLEHWNGKARKLQASHSPGGLQRR